MERHRLGDRCGGDPRRHPGAGAGRYSYLHGCSRWAVRLPELPSVSSPEKLERLLQEGRPADPDRGAVVRLRNYRFELLSDADSIHYPAMLFPSTVKRRYAPSPPFDFAYQQLLHALDRAAVVAIVGHSGRDETIKEILHRACVRRPELRVVILDPGGLSVHYADVIPRDHVRVIDDPGGLSTASIAKLVDACRFGGSTETYADARVADAD